MRRHPWWSGNGCAAATRCSLIHMPKVELFGQARVLARERSFDLPGATVAEVLQQLASTCPRLIGPVLEADGRPTAAYTLNINGTRFTSHLHTALASSDEVLLLSSLSGG